MKKRMISVLAVLTLLVFTAWGTKASATEQGLWFVYTSFDQVDYVELMNEDTGVCITLGPTDLFDYETYDFITAETKSVKVTKNFTDGRVLEQRFVIENAKSLVGIYDDGTNTESWLEIDGVYMY